MADPYYEIRLDLGDASRSESWTVTHTGDPYAADTMTPMAGLRFGWRMPENILWPLQPEAMTAAFAVNVPEFADIAWVGEDTPVAIEVKLDPDAGVQFAFYGRATDVQAVPRKGRPGVTLSVFAVDYTIDLARTLLENPSFDAEQAEDFIIADLWASRPTLFGDFPGWPLPLDGGFGHGFSVDLGDMDNKPYSSLIAGILAQAIRPDLLVPADIGGGVDGGLLIIAPNIDPATRLPDADQPWEFDFIYRKPKATHTIPAAIVDRSSTVWTRNKIQPPDRVQVTTSLGTIYIAPTTWGVTGFDLGVFAFLTVTSDSAFHVPDVAEFYLPDDVHLLRDWKVPDLRVMLDQLTPTEAEDFTDALMPRWTDAGGLGSRAVCYMSRVDLTGVMTDTNPFGEEANPSLIGLVGSADFSLEGGRPSLTLGFRQFNIDPPMAPGRGGYAMAPYGALVPIS